MLKINGSARLSFTFPADCQTTFIYFSNMHRLVSHLRYIALVEEYPDQQYRLLYQSSELNAYDIHVHCDVALDTSDQYNTIRVYPIVLHNQAEPRATMQSTYGQGSYSSEARFFDVGGDQTRIEYTLSLHADLLRPSSMRLMPGRVVDKIAQGITNKRIREIAEGFITDSIAAFPVWCSQQFSSNSPVQQFNH